MVKRATKRKKSRTKKRSCVSKFQRHVAGLFRLALRDSYVRYEVNWKWLKNEDDYALYLDIYFPHYALAVEAHGLQHFKYPNFFHKTYEEYEHQRKNDRTKRSILKDHGIKYIAIRDTPKPTLQDVERLLESVGIGPNYRPRLTGELTEYSDAAKRAPKPGERITCVKV